MQEKQTLTIELPFDMIVKEQIAAVIVGLTVPTLRTYRQTARGPEWERIGPTAVGYRVSELVEYRNQRRAAHVGCATPEMENSNV